MPIDDVLESPNPTSIMGKQVSLEALRNGQLALVNHVNKGKEPSISWQYSVIKTAAEAVGVEHSKFAFVTCSDEANDKAKSMVISHGNSYDLINPGAVAYFDRLQVGFHNGHKRLVVINMQHIGMYKEPQTGELLFGRVRGDEDGVTRACCGMLDAMLVRIAKGEQVPSEFEHLTALAPEIAQTSFEDPRAYSTIMWKATLANMRAQTRTIIDGLQESYRPKGHSERYVLAEGIAINRQKYPHTGILRGLYIMEGETACDLSQTPQRTTNPVATRKLVNLID